MAKQQQPEEINPLQLLMHAPNPVNIMMIPGKMWLPFTHVGFGIYANTPKQAIIASLSLFGYYEAVGLLYARLPDFVQSPSFTFLVCYWCLAIPHMLSALTTYWRRKEPRHSQFLGVPLFTRVLRIPFFPAWFLNIGCCGFFGYWVFQTQDKALGSWLIIGSLGLLGFIMAGINQRRRDQVNMVDSMIYSDFVQRDVTKRMDGPVGKGAKNEPIPTLSTKL
jgi:hypothetical protein